MKTYRRSFSLAGSASIGRTQPGTPDAVASRSGPAITRRPPCLAATIQRSTWSQTNRPCVGSMSVHGVGTETMSNSLWSEVFTMSGDFSTGTRTPSALAAPCLP